LISRFDWSIVMYVGVGAGVFLIGFSALIVAIRLASVIYRTNDTIAEVNKQLANLSAPVAETLSHVGGIADTADTTIARLGGVVGQLESVAGSVGKTATLAQDALAPSIVNIGSALAGVTAGIRRLTRGKAPENGSASELHREAKEHGDGSIG
jgi:ABC-type transporter Mla subunit MlaD